MSSLMAEMKRESKQASVVMLDLREQATKTGACVTSFLGPYKGMKIIESYPGQAKLINCPMLYLSEMSTSNAWSDLLVQSLSHYHQTYGCSVTTLIAMWHFWHQYICDLLENYDIRPSKVIDRTQCILEELIRNITNYSALHWSTLLLKYKPFLQRSQQCSNNLNSPRHQSKSLAVGISKSIVLRSRHLMEDFNEDSAENEPCEKCASALNADTNMPKESFERQLVTGLAHGCVDMVDALCRVWVMQIKRQTAENTGLFDTECISTYCIPGKVDSEVASVIEGLLVAPAANHLEINQAAMKEEYHRFILMNGSITPDHRHLGYTPGIAVTNVSSGISHTSEKQLWLNEVIDVIQQMRITAIFMKDSADEDFLAHCTRLNVAVFCKVPIKTLRTLSSASEVEIIEYVSECIEMYCIGEKMQIKMWEGCNETMGNDGLHMLISLDDAPHFIQTVIIWHPSQEYAKAMEHTFWHLAHRVHFATKHKLVAPGRGLIEEQCCKCLEKMEAEQDDYEEQAIIRAVKQGFQSYIEALHSNLESNSECLIRNLSINSGDTDSVLDEITSKTEAWKHAMKLSLLWCQTDLMIQTGCEINSLQAASESLPHQIIGIIR